jgi:xanthine dehydrogenase YagS FAD-binding subunit
MRPFRLVRITSLPDAQATVAENPDGRLWRAGGIDLLDRMKEGLDAPEQVIDLRALSDGDLGRWEIQRGALHLGALNTLAAVASGLADDRGREALRDAANDAATPSIRNMATLGGNLLQRPRCWYFRNAELPCLKKGGDMCLSTSGDNRYNAILGGGPSYIVHPSSLGPALLVLGAEVTTRQVSGEERRFGLAELFVLPAKSLEREHTLEPGEVLTSVILPKAEPTLRSAYSAARERAHHDWPLAEAAVALDLQGGKMSGVRVALGHVAPIPWPAPEANELLEGQAPSAALFEKAARAATASAMPLSRNRFKVPLVQGLIRDALHRATDLPSPA